MFGIVGVLSNVVGTGIIIWGVILTERQAVEVSVSRWVADEPVAQEIPAAWDRLKQSRNAKVGFVFILIGALLQILSYSYS